MAKDAFDKANYNLCIEYCNKSINLQANGWAYWERAAAFENLKKYQESLSDYTAAIPYYSSDYASLSKLYYWKGLCNSNLFDNKQAIKDFSQAYNYNYSDLGYLYWNRGYSYYFEFDYSNAETDLIRATSYFSSTPATQSKIYRLLGDCEYAEYKYDSALDSYSKAIEIDPGNIKSFESRANVYEKKGNYKNAIDDITKAIDYYNITPDEFLGKEYTATLYETRSNDYWITGEYEKGISDAKTSLQIDSTSHNAWWKLGINENGLGEYKKSIQAYNKAIANTKDTASIYTLYRNIALNYQNLLNYKEALKAVNISLQYSNNTYNTAYWTRAKIYVNLKQYVNAINDYDKAIQLYSNNKISQSTLYQERGELAYYNMNNSDKAMYDLNKALELNPNSTNVLYNNGRFLIESKKSPLEGKDLLAKCAEMELTKDTSSNYSYAKLFLGDKQTAISNQFRLLDKYKYTDNYQYKWELHVMACLYALSGDSKNAIEYQRQAFEAGFNDFNHLLNDRDLISIKNSPEYKALLIKYKMPTPQY